MARQDPAPDVGDIVRHRRADGRCVDGAVIGFYRYSVGDDAVVVFGDGSSDRIPIGALEVVERAGRTEPLSASFSAVV
jgi:hypothetical protein